MPVEGAQSKSVAERPPSCAVGDCHQRLDCGGPRKFTPLRACCDSIATVVNTQPFSSTQRQTIILAPYKRKSMPFHSIQVNNVIHRTLLGSSALSVQLSPGHGLYGLANSTTYKLCLEFGCRSRKCVKTMRRAPKVRKIRFICNARLIACATMDTILHQATFPSVSTRLGTHQFDRRLSLEFLSRLWSRSVSAASHKGRRSLSSRLACFKFCFVSSPPVAPVNVDVRHLLALAGCGL
jgi:hypothetical protein